MSKRKRGKATSKAPPHNQANVETHTGQHDENAGVSVKQELAIAVVETHSNDEDHKVEIEEWKECHNTMARLAKAVVDLRKYGFVMVVALVTAKALAYLYIGTPPDPDSGKGVLSLVANILTPDEVSNERLMMFQTRIATSLFTMLLIFALFVADRREEVLLWAARDRAIYLERQLGMRLTTRMRKTGRSSFTRWWGVSLYILFILSNFFAIILTTINLNNFRMGKASPECKNFFWSIIALTLFFLIIGCWYHWITKDAHKSKKNRDEKTDKVQSM